MPAFYGAIDLAKNELRNAVIQNLGSPPGSPVKGQVYFDSTGNVLYWYSGTQWVAAQGGAGAVPSDTVTTQAVGDTAVQGSSTLYSRGDHKHGREAFGAVVAETTFGTASANGSSANVTRADHTHGNPTHDAAAHSAIPLSALAVPTGSLNLNSQKITNLADPTVSTDAANKNYVDNTTQGLDAKASVRAASTANIAALSGTGTFDGIALVAGDRILVKDQTTQSANGIYLVAAGAWTRATDMDTWQEVPSAYTWVEQGTAQADTGWVSTADQGGTLGTTAITWTQFSGAGQITAGAGLTKTGNTIDAVAGDTSLVVNADELHVNTAVIATVASLAAKANTTTTVTAGNGLTGGGDLSANRTLTVGAGTGILSTAGQVAVDTSVIATVASVTAATAPLPKKYAAALTGTASPETVTHNLNTRDIQVTVLNGATPYTAVEVDWDATTANTVTVRYNPNLGSGYRIVVVG